MNSAITAGGAPVEANRSTVVRIADREAVGGHAHSDYLRITSKGAPGRGSTGRMSVLPGQLCSEDRFRGIDQLVTNLHSWFVLARTHDAKYSESSFGGAKDVGVGPVMPED